MSRFTTNVEFLMAVRGTNWYKVSNDLGLSHGSLTYWKANDTQPKMTTLKALADYFEVSVEQLLGFEQIGSNAEIMSEEDTESALDNIYLEMYKLLDIKDKIEVMGIVMHKLEGYKK